MSKFIRLKNTSINLNYIVPQNASVNVYCKFNIYSQLSPTDVTADDAWNIISNSGGYISSNAFCLFYNARRQAITLYCGGVYYDYLVRNYVINDHISEYTMNINSIVFDDVTTNYNRANYYSPTLPLIVHPKDNVSNVYRGIVDIYEIKIYDGNTLIHNYEPHADSNGYGELYDTVTSTVYSALTPSEVEYYAPLSLDKNNINHNQTAFTDTINITSEGAWTATTEYDWISLSKVSGSGDDSVTVSVNATNVQRTGTVLFTSGSDTVTLTISQRIDIPIHKIYHGATLVNKEYQSGLIKKTYKGNDYRFNYLCADPNIYINVDDHNKGLIESSTVQLTITSTYKWTATVNNPKLSLSTSGGVGTTNMTISADSTWTTGDTAVITLTNDYTSTTVNVTYKKLSPDANEIWYKTINNQPLTLDAQYFTGTGGTSLSIVSNEYDSVLQCFVVKFSGEIKKVSSKWSQPSGCIGYDGWNRNSYIYWIQLPEGVVELQNTFDQMRYNSASVHLTAILPSTITSMHSETFYGQSGNTVIIIYATTPPTLGTDNDIPSWAVSDIYVPAESVNAYKTASRWSNVASKIHPIE